MVLTLGRLFKRRDESSVTVRENGRARAVAERWRAEMTRTSSLRQLIQQNSREVNIVGINDLPPSSVGSETLINQDSLYGNQSSYNDLLSDGTESSCTTFVAEDEWALPTSGVPGKKGEDTWHFYKENLGGVSKLQVTVGHLKQYLPLLVRNHTDIFYVIVLLLLELILGKRVNIPSKGKNRYLHAALTDKLTSDGWCSQYGVSHKIQCTTRPLSYTHKVKIAILDTGIDRQTSHGSYWKRLSILQEASLAGKLQNVRVMCERTSETTTIGFISDFDRLMQLKDIPRNPVVHYAAAVSSHGLSTDFLASVLHTGAYAYDFRNGTTPLHQAVEFENVGLVNYLLEHGADANTVDRERQWTPLHVAASKGWLSVAKLLLQAGASPNRLDPKSGLGPLHYALMQGDTKMSTLLISNGASFMVDEIKYHADRNIRWFTRLSLYFEERPGKKTKTCAPGDVNQPSSPFSSSCTAASYSAGNRSTNSSQKRGKPEQDSDQEGGGGRKKIRRSKADAAAGINKRDTERVRCPFDVHPHRGDRDMCSMEFSEGSRLKSHILEKHVRETCPFCDGPLRGDGTVQTSHLHLQHPCAQGFIFQDPSNESQLSWNPLDGIAFHQVRKFRENRLMNMTLVAKFRKFWTILFPGVDVPAENQWLLRPGQYLTSSIAAESRSANISFATPQSANFTSHQANSSDRSSNERDFQANENSTYDASFMTTQTASFQSSEVEAVGDSVDIMDTFIRGLTPATRAELMRRTLRYTLHDPPWVGNNFPAPSAMPDTSIANPDGTSTNNEAERLTQAPSRRLPPAIRLENQHLLPFFEDAYSDSAYYDSIGDQSYLSQDAFPSDPFGFTDPSSAPSPGPADRTTAVDPRVTTRSTSDDVEGEGRVL